MVNKEFILKLLQNNSISNNDFITIIESYCLDMGKDKDKTSLFIQALMNYPFIDYNDYLSHALNYYEKKFNIMSLIINGKKVYFKQEF